MNRLRRSDPAYSKKLESAISVAGLFNSDIESRTRQILDQVETLGDAALIEFSERFDGVKLDASELRISTAERLAASLAAPLSTREAIAAASANIAAFSRKSLRKNWSAKNREGGIVGEKFEPLERVGIYVPGGTAPLVSTALMTLVPAKVAGCREIVVCTPPGKDRSINPALLFALNHAGATDIFRVGGAQAIAAMALGTATIAPVQKIFGPGNSYVVAAKRLLFGRVGIDLLPGPSELLVVADETAEPKFIAADLLAQAEHGSGHERIWLVTPSKALISKVEAEMKRQIAALAREAEIRRTPNCWLIEVRDMDEAIAIANRIAPEHCEIITRQDTRVAARIQTAGAIFLGPYSPAVLGDYVAGPSHVLPTGGAARFSAGLTADQFQRRTSIIQYDRSALQKALPHVQKFAELEGLTAHGNSAAIRTARKSASSRRK